jgi:hypothetical protein
MISDSVTIFFYRTLSFKLDQISEKEDNHTPATFEIKAVTVYNKGNNSESEWNLDHTHHTCT